MSDQDVDNGCHYDDDKQGDEKTSVAAAEAGITRGALRSLGKSAIRLPAVGRLPVARRGVSVRPRLQVKQIARVSDRVSTGLDVLSTVQKANLKWKLSRFRRLVTSESTYAFAK